MYEFVQLSQWQASSQLAVSLISKRIFIMKKDRTHNWWRQLEKQKQQGKGRGIFTPYMKQGRRGLQSTKDKYFNRSVFGKKDD